MRKTPYGIEAQFKKKFNGIIWRSAYNNGGLVYILNKKEYDISFLSLKDIKDLMQESLKINSNLILQACKNKEIKHTKENDALNLWRSYY